MTDNPYDNAPQMGHNEPPEQTPAERVEELILSAGECPEDLKTLDNAHKAMLLAKQLKIEHTRLDDEKGQFLNEAKKKQAEGRRIFDGDMKALEEGRQKVLLALGRYMSDNGEMDLKNNFGQSANLDADVTFEIVDRDKLPRKYMKPDDAALRKAIKADAKIPGVIRKVTPKATVR